MPNLGPTELALLLWFAVGLILPLTLLYLIIRQAVLSALRKFYRELEETGSKNKANAAI